MNQIKSQGHLMNQIKSQVHLMNQIEPQGHLMNQIPICRLPRDVHVKPVALVVRLGIVYE